MYPNSRQNQLEERQLEDEGTRAASQEFLLAHPASRIALEMLLRADELIPRAVLMQLIPQLLETVLPMRGRAGGERQMKEGRRR